MLGSAGFESGGVETLETRGGERRGSGGDQENKWREIGEVAGVVLLRGIEEKKWRVYFIYFFS